VIVDFIEISNTLNSYYNCLSFGRLIVTTYYDEL